MYHGQFYVVSHDSCSDVYGAPLGTWHENSVIDSFLVPPLVFVLRTRTPPPRTACRATTAPTAFEWTACLVVQIESQRALAEAHRDASDVSAAGTEHPRRNFGRSAQFSPQTCFLARPAPSIAHRFGAGRPRPILVGPIYHKRPRRRAIASHSLHRLPCLRRQHRVNRQFISSSRPCGPELIWRS